METSKGAESIAPNTALSNVSPETPQATVSVNTASKQATEVEPAISTDGIRPTDSSSIAKAGTRTDKIQPSSTNESGAQQSGQLTTTTPPPESSSHKSEGQLPETTPTQPQSSDATKHPGVTQAPGEGGSRGESFTFTASQALPIESHSKQSQSTPGSPTPVESAQIDTLPSSGTQRVPGQSSSAQMSTPASAAQPSTGSSGPVVPVAPANTGGYNNAEPLFKIPPSEGGHGQNSTIPGNGHSGPNQPGQGNQGQGSTNPGNGQPSPNQPPSLPNNGVGQEQQGQSTTTPNSNQPSSWPNYEPGQEQQGQGSTVPVDGQPRPEQPPSSPKNRQHPESDKPGAGLNNGVNGGSSTPDETSNGKGQFGTDQSKSPSNTPENREGNTQGQPSSPGSIKEIPKPQK